VVGVHAAVDAVVADLPTVARPRLRVWSPEQTRASPAAVANDRLFAAWLLAATTGMCRGELLGLRWGDIDLDAGEDDAAPSLTATVTSSTKG
jgi:integrase